MNLINRFLIVFLCAAGLFSIAAQTPTVTPTPNIVGEVSITATKANVEPTYTELRKLSEKSSLFSGEYGSVNNLIIKRDAATFILKSGEIYFPPAIQGKTIGAVFIGEGEMIMTPPVESEKKMLSFFVNSSEFKEQISGLVMFFSDETYNEVKNSKQVTMSANGGQSEKARQLFREKESVFKNQFHFNITTRHLMDIYAPARPGFFTAFIEGKNNSKLVYQLDPLGIPEVSPEQVMLLNYDANNSGVWSAFHLAEEYIKGTASNSVDRRLFDLVKHEIDLTIRNTRMLATDRITIKNLVEGQRVLPFDLFPALRVKRVLDSSGKELDIIQEDKNKDGSLAVILPNAPQTKVPFTLTFEYEGEEALRQAGAGNYILIPRSTWYPNNALTSFGDRAAFDITLRYPKQFVMIGVGELVEPEKTDGNWKVAHWSSRDQEMAVAGFNYGDFIRKDVRDEPTGYNLEVYVNREIPDQLKAMQIGIEQAESRGQETFTTLGSLTTSSLAQTVLGDSQNAVRIFDNYFGKMPFSRIAMSQQPAGNFGQAWGSLIYMPYFAFISETQRAQLFGIKGGTNEFWREVGAHEIAHQWWGHAIGWSSYHDQWMSEGFAQLSTSIYIQYVKKDIKAFNDFWEGERAQIINSSPQTKSLKPYTVGPVTQGFRLNSAKSGNAYRFLVYPKGAFILHMLRMMMYDPKTGDARFKKMMQDFVATHFNKDVSTEDFKAIVDKHITPEMNLYQNGKIDWFFNQWVYGTEIPAYKFDYKLTKSDNKMILNAKLTQSGVSDDFVMSVPVYLDFGNGWIRLGAVTITGNKTLDLNGIELPANVKKVTINALNDVLTTKVEVSK